MTEIKTKIPFLQKHLTVIALMILGSIILISSFYKPYWEMHLSAPQYPDGLHVYTYLNGVRGDTVEINELNHYIGMGKIEAAAEFERSLSWIVLLSLAVGGVIVGSLRFNIYRIFYLPPFLFLIGFLCDFSYQMYRFGHDLDPNAPIKLKPFMPSLLGTGKIGQFTSTAYLSTGFWMAFIASLIFLLALTNKRARQKNSDVLKAISVMRVK